MSTLHNVKIKINELGKGQVYLDDKPLITTGTDVKTGAAIEDGYSGFPPAVTIYTIAETLDQEITTDNITIIEAEACLRIWQYDEAPEQYKSLSSTKWENSWIMRVPKRGGPKGMVSRIIDERYQETYDLDDSYTVIIWGFQEK